MRGVDRLINEYKFYGLLWHVNTIMKDKWIGYQKSRGVYYTLCVGYIYSALMCAHILIDSPGEKCSRPLGLDFDSAGNLIVADPFKGLLKINVTTGEKHLLAGDESQDPSVIPAFNNLVVLPNGSIFVTKLCKRNDFTLEVLEGVPNGNLLHYNPATKTIHTVVSDLFMPNGLSHSHDGQSILISESGKARILR